MFAVIRLNRRKWMALGVLAVLSVTMAMAFCFPRYDGEAESVTVAIDPGHGGYDGGVTGLRLRLKESDVNLSVAKYLATYLKNNGYKVVLTRSGDRSPVEAGSMKRRDMDLRLAAIEGAKADIAVSIHCNFYPSKYRRGIQVFYDKESDLTLAETIQNHLNETQNLPNVGRQFAPLWGDYYLLKNAPCPAAIVECGFLSNAEDEALLADENYRMTLAYQIYLAIDSMYPKEDAPTLAW